MVDSRLAEEGASIRRRRECLNCERRFTTFERVEEEPLFVVKRSGQREPFDRNKLVEGVRAACKNRPVTKRPCRNSPSRSKRSCGSNGRADEPTGRSGGPRAAARDSTTSRTSASPSVYKGFEDADDFHRETGMLVKTTEPKRRAEAKAVPELIAAAPAVALAVYAHPDDADVAAGGTLASGPRRVARCTSSCAPTGRGRSTRARTGSAGGVRAGELAAAAAVVGLASFQSSALPTVGSTTRASSSASWWDGFGATRPDVVFGHDPTAVFFGQEYFNHRDHRAAGWA